MIIGLSEKTIIIAAEARSRSSATANRALSQGCEVIITRHVAAKIERQRSLKILGNLKACSVWIAKIRKNEYISKAAEVGRKIVIFSFL